MKKIIVICAVVLLFAPLFSMAESATPNAGDPAYYALTVNWDSESNALSLSGDVTLTKQNVLKDTGSGSQFYARVINLGNKAKVFQSGDSKIFLGKWEPAADPKKTEVKITVPYFSDGGKVIIFDSKDKKAKLVVDVLKFSKVQKAVGNTAEKKPAAAAAQAAASGTAAQTYLIGGHSAAYWWTMRIIILLILGGGGYFLWRWRKKKKMQNSGAVNLVQNNLKK